MKRKLRVISMMLALVLLLGATTSAFALSGKVHGGRLRLRKRATVNSIYLGYIPNGTVVTIYDDGVVTKEDGEDWFYHINAWSYDSKKNYAYRDGYGMQKFIK